MIPAFRMWTGPSEIHAANPATGPDLVFSLGFARQLARDLPGLIEDSRQLRLQEALANEPDE